MSHIGGRQPQAYAYGLAAVLLWSTVASAFELSLRVLSPTQLLLGASLFSTLALLLVLLVQRKLHLLRATTRRQWLRSALAGGMSPFLYYSMLFEAYARLPGQEAQPLNYTWSIALALLSIPLLKQRIRPAGFLALGISLLGVSVIATRGQVLALRPTDALGVGLALGSSVVWALYWILNLRDGRDGVVKLFLGFLWGFGFTAGFAAWRGVPVPPWGAGWSGAAYVGCFEMGFTFVLWLTALRLSATTARVANLIFLAPFLSLLLLHFVVGEELFPSSVVGLALIVAGIALQRRCG
ncbi:MAG: DMT family transporter [Candidatus Eisenbacteria bacterium]|uniref:DMT family transporter n=1 Tax=Eiseniibacteriota bacterium TaxID=2212470 RepID=A0A938BLX5_UNCEI|nr:DMT family transporter [Candidatus Eisenbacteria bacterium]